MRRRGRSSRSRFTWGIVLFAVGAYALAYNLGARVPRDIWEYWPALIMGLGLAQIAWPGSIRERLGGVTFFGVGVYCWIGNFESFDLDWYSALPVLIVAIGVRIMLGGVFRQERKEELEELEELKEELKELRKEGEQNNQGGVT